MLAKVEVAGVVAIYSTTVRRDIRTSKHVESSLECSSMYPECRKKYTNLRQSQPRFAVVYAKGKYATKQGCLHASATAFESQPAEVRLI